MGRRLCGNRLARDQRCRVADPREGQRVNSAEIIRWLKRIPFRRFRICLTDGTGIDVLHPEEVIALKGTALVARRDLSGIPAQPYTTISLLHVVRLEPIGRAN